MKMNKIMIGVSTAVLIVPGTMLATSVASTHKSTNQRKDLNVFSNNMYESSFESNAINKVIIKGDKNIVTVADEVKSTTASDSEGRWMYHADHIPTGLLVRKGQTVKINVEEINPNSSPRVYIKAPGEWSGLENTGSSRENLEDGDNTFVADNTGVIYVTLNGKDAKVKYEIDNTNLEQVPTFYKGDDETKFFELLKKSKSPVVNIVSDWIVNMVGVKKFKSVFLTSSGEPKHSFTINKTLNNWDRLINYYSKLSGVSVAGTGITKKHTHKINLFTPKGSHGWANSGGVVSIGENWFSEILEGKSDWVIGHELGHTWQNSNMSWEGVTEVIPNIFTALWQEKYHELSTKEKPWNRVVENNPDVMERIRTAFTTKTNLKDFDSMEWAQQLMMFLQLQKGFGENFIPTLSQYYRIYESEEVEGRTGLTEMEKILSSGGLDKDVHFRDIVNTTKEEKKQVFMRASMNVTGYNLTNFFKFWGLTPNKETLHLAETKKAMTKDIQANYLEGTNPKKMHVQKKLSAYNPIQLRSQDLDLNIDTYMSEPKSVTEAKILAKIKDKIPSNYKVEVIGDDYTDYYTRKFIVNIFDPKNKYATENGFVFNIKNANIIHKDSKPISNYWITDLLELDLDKKEGETNFISGLIIPTQAHLHDLWIFDTPNGHPYHYDSKTTKLKDGMIVRIILDPSYMRKFVDTGSSWNSDFDENDERIYLKSSGSMVYEKRIKIIS